MIKRDKTKHPRTLLVEGADDLHAIIHLMKAHIDWPDSPQDRPVHLIEWQRVDNILTNALTTEIKSEHIRIFGLILDADQSAAGRYQRVRQLCRELFPGLPDSMPPEGLVAEHGDKRFGLWIMPDNVANGDLETFLKLLVPGNSANLWELATESVDRAIETGAQCTGHETKARLYTWLAWQKDPGQSPGIALTAKVLDPASASAQPFVAWFKELYKI